MTATGGGAHRVTPALRPLKPDPGFLILLPQARVWHTTLLIGRSAEKVECPGVRSMRVQGSTGVEGWVPMRADKGWWAASISIPIM